MAQREFSTEQLIAWHVHHGWEDEDDTAVVDAEDVGMHSFEVTARLVFRAPDDGKLYCLTYEYNNGSGYDSITGISACIGDGTLKPERPSFVCNEVRAVQTVVTKYEVVSDGIPN